MRKEIIKDFKLISNSNSTKFEEEVKAFIQKHKFTDIQFNTTESGHYAYILFDREEVISEDIRDEYILDGYDFRCGNCPYWGEHALDDPRKAMTCTKYVTKNPRFCSRACLFFYQKYAKGEILPIDSPSVDAHKKEEKEGWNTQYGARK